MVIFGAAGDLTKRKLIPALYNLKQSNLLSDNFAVVGVARAEMNATEFQRQLSDDMREFCTDGVDPEVWQWLAERLYYLSADFTDEQTFVQLKELLGKVDAERNTQGNYLFYLATAPDYFARVAESLGSAGLTNEEDDRWRRVVIEKPFGRDLESALKLNTLVRSVLKEKETYRIDHYLGKETVQNVLFFRFANAILSRSGITPRLSTSRSPRPSRSALKNAGRTTKKPARCAT